MKQITEKRKLGNLGEDIACRFLVKHGFKIIEKNYLKKCGEIDIVAKKLNILHFIEVKSISGEIIRYINQNTDQGDEYKAEDNLHPWKLQRISKTMQIYLIENNVSPETEWQFDVITVKIDKKRLVSQVKMLENIVL